MIVFRNISFQGASGKEYEFSLIPYNGVPPVMEGLAVFINQDAMGKSSAKIISDLNEFDSSIVKEEDITHLGIRVIKDQKIRSRILNDLKILNN